MFPYPETNWFVPLSPYEIYFIFSVPEIVFFPLSLNLALVPLKINAPNPLLGLITYFA